MGEEKTGPGRRIVEGGILLCVCTEGDRKGGREGGTNGWLTDRLELDGEGRRKKGASGGRQEDVDRRKKGDKKGEEERRREKVDKEGTQEEREENRSGE